MLLLVWWLCSTLLGLAALPLTGWLFARLPGRGTAFARPLGLLTAAYLFWIGVSARILPNTLSSVLISLGLLVAPGWALAGRRAALAHLRQQARWLLLSELIFAAAFLAWAGLRAFTIERVMPAGGEKYMEMAFLNSILRSPAFPPADPWLAGQPISYYYFGYVMMAWMTRLTQSLAGPAFDLYDALLFALTVQGAFGLAAEMAALSGLSRAGKLLSGAAAAFFTAGMGNLEGLIEVLTARGWAGSRFLAWLNVPGLLAAASPNGSFSPGGGWWWWRAARVIQDVDLSGSPISASPITEFPFFSFLLGDNHPHVLALPFVLTGIALALDWTAAAGRISRLRLAAAALLAGSLLFLNTWDFPACVLLLVGGALIGETTHAALLWPALRKAALRLASLCAGAALLYAPFLAGFHSQAGGILPYIFPPTRLAQFTLQFGPFLLLSAAFLALLICQAAAHPGQHLAQKAARTWLWLVLGLTAADLALLGLSAAVLVIDQMSGGQLAQNASPWLGGAGVAAGMLRILAARLAKPGVFLILSLLLALSAAALRARPALPAPGAPDLGTRFALLLILAGCTLILAPEFIYLRDSFGVRMNTVFKFYFQGWVLLACACGYALGWVLCRARRWRGPFLLAAAVLAAAGLAYPAAAISSRTAGFSASPVLDSTLPLRRSQPDDWAAIDWLNTAVPPGQTAVLLEAPCPAYCPAGRMSAFTGIPTVLGWSSHEIQWRGSGSEPALRAAEIAAIYTSLSDPDTLARLRQRQVRYVILGEIERGYIAALCQPQTATCSPAASAAKLERILLPVFHNATTSVYALPAGP